MQCRRPRFNPWVEKIPWRRERLPTPVFWPGEFHGLHSPWGCKESDTTERLSLSLHFHLAISFGFSVERFFYFLDCVFRVISMKLWERPFILEAPFSVISLMIHGATLYWKNLWKNLGYKVMKYFRTFSSLNKEAVNLYSASTCQVD